MSPIYHIGTSGWHYNHWRGVFYPDKLPPKDWLDFYSRRFDTVEINNSFYRLPQESTFDIWRQAVPPEFCFAVKASRFITHVKRLKDSAEPVRTLTGRVSRLENNLGPLLYQLPHNFHRDTERLESFLLLLDKNQRHVFEFRHHSWMENSVFDLMRKYNAGFCIFDMPGFTSPLLATADFAYMRFHGHNDLYTSCYPDAELSHWANKLRDLSSGMDAVYIYFNNDNGGFAVENALTLRKYLEGK